MVRMEFDRRILMEMEVFTLKPDLITNGILIWGDVSGPSLMGNKEGRGEIGAELGQWRRWSETAGVEEDGVERGSEVG